MTPEKQWLRVVELLDPPLEAAVLVLAPNGERGAVSVIQKVRPKARLLVLDSAFAPGDQLAPDSLDLALLDHAIDDIALEAVARCERIESGDRDIGEYAARSRALRAYWRAGDLEEVVVPAFVKVMTACRQALRRSGRIVLHHRVVPADLAGQPMDLYTDYLLFARRWVGGLDLGLREIAVDGLEAQWWLCLEGTG